MASSLKVVVLFAYCFLMHLEVTLARSTSVRGTTVDEDNGFIESKPAPTTKQPENVQEKWDREVKQREQDELSKRKEAWVTRMNDCIDSGEFHVKCIMMGPEKPSIQGIPRPGYH